MQKRSKTTERDVVGVEGGKEKAKKAVTVENKVTPATVKKAGGSKKAVTVEKKVTATTVKKGKESKKAVTVNKKVAAKYIYISFFSQLEQVTGTWKSLFFGEKHGNRTLDKEKPGDIYHYFSIKQEYCLENTGKTCNNSTLVY